VRIYLIIILLFSFLYSYSQNRDDLENKKKSLNSEIKYTNELLEKTATDRKQEYNKLLLLNSTIRSRNNLIKSIEDEIVYLGNEQQKNDQILSVLNSDLDKYKKEYAKMVYSAYKLKSDYDILIYILASESVNTAFNRMRYLKEYSNSRKQLFNEIENTKLSINNKLLELEELKQEKEHLFVEKKLESRQLQNEKLEQNSLVSKLLEKEKELKLQLKDKEQIANKIQKEIERMIAEEAKKAVNGKMVLAMTPEEKELASVFEKNKNKLPWPTERGVVTSNFGEQPHPVLKGVIIRNDGIDIMTNKDATVRAVYKGKVSRVFAIPGANRTVIIRHGNYLSVYSNLKDVIVKQGDIVDTKQIIGVAHTEKEGEQKTVIQFQIWKENTKMDPLQWLAGLNNG